MAQIQVNLKYDNIFTGIVINLNKGQSRFFVKPDWTQPDDDDNIFGHLDRQNTPVQDRAVKCFIKEGMHVTFQIGFDSNNRPVAINVCRFEDSVDHIVIDRPEWLPSRDEILKNRMRVKLATKNNEELIETQQSASKIDIASYEDTEEDEIEDLDEVEDLYVVVDDDIDDYEDEMDFYDHHSNHGHHKTKAYPAKKHSRWN